MDKKRLGTFVVGSLAGLLAGILLAPKSGRETRGGLADRAGEARQKSGETFYDARERLRERVSSGGGDGGGMTHDLSGSTRMPERPEPPAELRIPPAADPAPRPAGERPTLRDVSRDAPPQPTAAPESSRSEELRRRVRETQERIRSREDGEPHGGSTDDAR